MSWSTSSGGARAASTRTRPDPRQRRRRGRERQQHRVDGRVREQDRRRTVRRDPQAHVAGKVSRELEGGHALRQFSRRRRSPRSRRERSCGRHAACRTARELDAVRVRDVARVRKDERAVSVGVPADVVDMEMRQEDDVDPPARRPFGERGQQSLLPLRRPAPEARRPDARVDEDGRAAGAKQVRGAADPPSRAGEQLRIERSLYGIPVAEARVELSSSPSSPTASTSGTSSTEPTINARAHASPHGRMRGGAGSPCASCQETTGLRSTPIRSISASITSPGFR